MDKRWVHASLLLFVTIAVVFIFNAIFAENFATKARAAELDKRSTLSDITIATSKSQKFLSNGVTAHRGFSGGYPENTMEAFEQALELGVDWVELDIFTTADGQVVVSHDATTGRFADRNLRIADHTYEELATLDVAYKYRENNGLTEREVPKMRMPLLSEVLDMIGKQNKTRLSIQPKDGSTAAAVAMIQEKGLQHLTGFNDGNLAKMSLVKELDPTIHVFWDLPASGDIENEMAIAHDRGFESLVVNQNRISPELIQQIKAGGFEVGAWTVNDTATMQRFIDWGIDRLYTDHPDQAMLLFGHDDRRLLKKGLVGYWDFDERQGSFANESASPNPLRDGRLIDDAHFDSNSNGLLKRAVVLDGNLDYVDVPLQVLPNAQTAYTASAWFKPESIASSDRQFILETSGSWAISVELAAQTGHLKYSIQTNGTSVIAESTSVPIQNTWNHVAVTYDQATGASALYLNGVEVTDFTPNPKETATGSLTSTNGLHIGTYRDANARFFKGSIDEVGVWNRVLTTGELDKIWNNGKGAKSLKGKPNTNM
jgi:glycerophosphoryl diester phosphodiesterase